MSESKMKSKMLSDIMSNASAKRQASTELKQLDQLKRLNRSPNHLSMYHTSDQLVDQTQHQPRKLQVISEIDFDTEVALLKDIYMLSRSMLHSQFDYVECNSLESILAMQSVDTFIIKKELVTCVQWIKQAVYSYEEIDLESIELAEETFKLANSNSSIEKDITRRIVKLLISESIRHNTFLSNLDALIDMLPNAFSQLSKRAFVCVRKNYLDMIYSVLDSIVAQSNTMLIELLSEC